MTKVIFGVILLTYVTRTVTDDRSTTNTVTSIIYNIIVLTMGLCRLTVIYNFGSLSLVQRYRVIDKIVVEVIKDKNRDMSTKIKQSNLDNTVITGLNG